MSKARKVIIAMLAIVGSVAAAVGLVAHVLTDRIQLKSLPSAAFSAATDRPTDSVSAAVPPVVIATVPESGSPDVDPSLSEIRVTFSKDMITDRMWSFVQDSPETFPSLNGQIHYLEDNRTCVLPVQLEPGKLYAIWINSEKFKNFKDANGQPALPYLLIFQTKK